MGTNEEQAVSAQITRVLNDYQDIFGDLNLPDDLPSAEKELESLVKKNKALQTARAAKQRVKHQSPDRAQKLAEYDHFCQKSAAEKQQQRIDDIVVDLTAIHSNEDSDSSNTVKSRLEIMAEERDYKRRRQSYKGGKTGSVKRSYTEVIRDVIESQSDMLRTMIKDDERKIKKEPS